MINERLIGKYVARSCDGLTEILFYISLKSPRKTQKPQSRYPKCRPNFETRMIWACHFKNMRKTRKQYKAIGRRSRGKKRPRLEDCHRFADNTDINDRESQC